MADDTGRRVVEVVRVQELNGDNMSAISQERVDELQELFWSETNAEETQEWRDYLTAEETDLVTGWDNGYDYGIHNIAGQILSLQKAVSNG